MKYEQKMDHQLWLQLNRSCFIIQKRLSIVQSFILHQWFLLFYFDFFKNCQNQQKIHFYLTKYIVIISAWFTFARAPGPGWNSGPKHRLRKIFNIWEGFKHLWVKKSADRTFEWGIHCGPGGWPRGRGCPLICILQYDICIISGTF